MKAKINGQWPAHRGQLIWSQDSRVKRQCSIVRHGEKKDNSGIRNSYIHTIWGWTPLSFSLLSFLPFHLNKVLSSSDKNTVSRRASREFVRKPGPILHLPVPAPCSSPPLLQWSHRLLLHSSSTLSLVSSSHFLSIFRFYPPTDYLQDYRFSVGCDWVSLGVMWALRCLLNGEHHELWTNYSHSSTTPESQADTHIHTDTHTLAALCNVNRLCAEMDTHKHPSCHCGKVHSRTHTSYKMMRRLTLLHIRSKIPHTDIVNQ